VTWIRSQILDIVVQFYAHVMKNNFEFRWAARERERERERKRRKGRIRLYARQIKIILR
jgi:hypothetical protein